MVTRAPFHSKSKIPREGSDWPCLDQSSVASRGRGQGHIVQNCYFHGNPVDVCGSNKKSGLNRHSKVVHYPSHSALGFLFFLV